MWHLKSGYVTANKPTAVCQTRTQIDWSTTAKQIMSWKKNSGTEWRFAVGQYSCHTPWCSTKMFDPLSWVICSNRRRKTWMESSKTQSWRAAKMSRWHQPMANFLLWEMVLRAEINLHRLGGRRVSPKSMVMQIASRPRQLFGSWERG